MKRVLVDQGSSLEIMYLDLFRGLKLRPEVLTYYDSPLIGFDRKMVFLKGQIRLLVQKRSEVMEVNFIIVIPTPPILLLWQGLGFTPWEPCLPPFT